MFTSKGENTIFMNKKRLIFTVFSVSTIILYLGLAYVIYEMYAVMWLDLHAPESLTPYLLILIIPFLIILGIFSVFLVKEKKHLLSPVVINHFLIPILIILCLKGNVKFLYLITFPLILLGIIIQVFFLLKFISSRGEQSNDII